MKFIPSTRFDLPDSRFDRPRFSELERDPAGKIQFAD
jgi:hypothetical protein